MNQPTPPEKPRSKAPVYIFGCLFAFLGLMTVVLALSIGPVTESIVEAELESHGFDCEPLDLDVSMFAGTAVLAPTVCSNPEGPIASISTSADVTIALSGFRPESIQAGEIQVELRPRARVDVGNDMFSRLSNLQDVHEQIGRLLQDGAELSSKDFPEVTVTSVRLSRGGAPVADMSNVALASEVGKWELTATQIRFAGNGGTSVDGLFSEFTPTTGRVSGQVDASTSVLGFRVGARVAATISATALDTPSPRFSLSIN